MSDIGICNLSLAALGLSAIASLDDKRPEARLCKVFFPSCRDLVLCDHEWNFAHKRRTLAGFDMPEDYAGKYLYTYIVPADCLKPRRVYAPEATEDSCYEIMRAPTGEKIILTDVENAILSYTVWVTDSTWFDPTFIHALSLLLASKLANPLLKNINLATYLLNAYRLALPQAKVLNIKEEKKQANTADSWISSRTASS